MENNDLLKTNEEETIPPVDPDNPDTPTPDEPDVPVEPVEPEPEPTPEPEFYYQTIPMFYERVRSSLNVGNMISDSVIDYFENAPLAELKMKQRVENWEELDETQTLLFQTCIIYMTCYALCPIASTMRISRQKDPSLEIEFAASQQQGSSCDKFLSFVDDLVSQITGEETPLTFGFKVTTGSGCKQCKPCWPYFRSSQGFEPL